MPYLTNVNSLSLDHKVPQSELRSLADRSFRNSINDIDRLLTSFENAGIRERNLCVPLTYFDEEHSFSKRNDDYISIVTELTLRSVIDCLGTAGVSPGSVTDLIFVSSTGLSTPSIDARIFNRLDLNKFVRRVPLWGLGCAGGVAGVSLACKLAQSDEETVALVVAAELCSLTFIRADSSKSNLIATGLFSDGIASALVCGDKAAGNVKNSLKLRFMDSQSRIYKDSLDVMGWEIINDGFKVVFSKDIPTIVGEKVKDDVEEFLSLNQTDISGVKNFIVHPGGAKVLDAYIDSLGIDEQSLSCTKKVLSDFGNMSSGTVLYVLDEFSRKGLSKGRSLMASLGPGFTSELILFDAE